MLLDRAFPLLHSVRNDLHLRVLHLHHLPSTSLTSPHLHLSKLTNHTESVHISNKCSKIIHYLLNILLTHLYHTTIFLILHLHTTTQTLVYIQNSPHLPRSALNMQIYESLRSLLHMPTRGERRSTRTRTRQKLGQPRQRKRTRGEMNKEEPCRKSVDEIV